MAELSSFLEQLFNGEPLTVAPAWRPAALEAQRGEALAVLRARHDDDLLELAGPPFPLDETAAFWGARRLYLVAQAFRLRDEEPAAIARELRGRLPGRLTAERTHAVDLTLRFLPGILELARGLSPGDRLVELGRTLLARWPLSSVGVPDLVVPAGREAVLLRHFGLRLRYLDRILQAGDFTRLRRPALAAEARALLGAEADTLAPGLAESAAFPQALS